MPDQPDEIDALWQEPAGTPAPKDEVDALWADTATGPEIPAPAPIEADLPANAYSQATPVRLGSSIEITGLFRGGVRSTPGVVVADIAEQRYEADLQAKAPKLKALLGGINLTTQGGVDRHASILRLAKETGMHFDTAASNFDELEHMHRLAKADPVMWMKANPELTGLLFERPELAPVIRQDAKLNAVSRAWNWIKDHDIENSSFAPPEERAKGAAAKAERDRAKPETLTEDAQAKEVREGEWEILGTGVAIPKSIMTPGYRFTEAWAQQKISRSGYELLLARGRGDESAAQELQARINDLKLDSVRRNYQEGEAGRVLSSMATAAASTAYGLTEGLEVGTAAGTLVTAGTFAVTRMPGASVEAGLSAAALFGKAGAVKGTFELEAGSAYLSLLEAKGKDGRPISEETARTAAAVYGTLAAGIEFASWGPMLRAMGPVGELIKNGEMKAVTRAMVRSDAFRAAMTRAAKNWLPAALAEGGEEGLQDAVEQAVTLFATGHTLTEVPGKLDTNQVIASMGEGFIGGLGLGGMSVAIGITSASMQRDRALASGKLIEDLTGLAESPTVKAAPAAVAQMVAEATGKAGEPVTDLYVDTGQLVRLYQTQGADVNAAVTDLMGPEGPKLLQEALANGTRLRVPVAQYLERWGGTETAKALAEDTSTSATTPTRRQVDEFDDAVKEAAKDIEKEAATSEGEQEFLDVIEQQLEQIQGEGKGKARTQVNIWRAFVRTMQDKLGTNADEFFRGLTVMVEQADPQTDVEGHPIFGQAILEHRAASPGLTPAQRTTMRSEELFRDRNTGLLNDEAHRALPAPAGKLVGHVSVEGIKFINDNADHETADLLYRAVAKALHAIDPTAAKVGGDFRVYVKDQAELDAMLQLVRESMPEQLRGLEITGATGATYDEAGKTHGAANKERVAKGERADPRPPHPTLLDEYDKPEVMAPQKPKGLKGELKDLKFPTERAKAEIPAELTQKVGEMKPADYFNAAYVDQKTGEWTARGWAALPRKAHVVSIDVKGLRHINETLGPQYGDEMLLMMGAVAQAAGGNTFDFAHLHGDEYAAQSDDPKALEAFVDELEALLAGKPVMFPEPETGKLTPKFVEFHYGYGERTLEAADADLNTRKQRSKKARAAGLVVGRRQRARSEAELRGESGSDSAGDQQAPDARGEAEAVDPFAAGREKIAAMRSNKVDAQAFLDYVEGKRERPRIKPELERLLGRYGIVDPLGWPFDQFGRDLRRPMKSRGYVKQSGVGLVGNAADAFANRKSTPMSRAFFQPGGELLSLDTIREIAKTKGAKLDIVENNERITLSRIVVAEEHRSEGIGSDLMRYVVDYADRVGKQVALTPSVDFGATSKARLVAFYKRFGFVPNKGKSKDFTTRETMIREPLKALFAGGEKGKAPRGYATIDITKEAQKLFKIALSQEANLSTFLHESGHVFLKLLAQTAFDPAAPQNLKDDWATALKWLGAESFEKLTVEQHEKWARGFEAYLMEGKAPSSKLEAAFASFKLWLKGVYRSISNLNVELNDEIRGVFDRLLATEKELERQRNRMGFNMPTAQDILQMSPQEYRQYLDDIEAATEHAALQAEHTAMREKLRETEKWWKEELKNERQKAEEDYEQLPGRVAQQTLLGKGELKMQGEDGPLWLAREDVVAAVGDKAVKKFKTTTKATEKVGPDEVAEFLGFRTGKAMLEAVVELPDKAKWVKAKAIEAMAEKHGDILEDRQRMANIISKGLHGPMTAKILAREAAAMVAKTPGGVMVPDDVIRAAAKDQAAKMKLGRLDAGGILAAERKAAEEYAKACAQQNFAHALAMKNRQRLNMYLFREVTAARELRDDLFEQAQKMGGLKGRHRLGKGHPLFLGGSDLLLESLGMKAPSPREKPLPSLGEVITEMMRTDPGIGFEEAVVEGVLGRASKGPIDVRTVTVAEAKEVLGALKNIEAAARDRATIVIDGKRMAKEDAKAKLQQSAAANLPPLPPQPTKGAETFRQGLAGWWNAHDGELRKPEFMFNRLGGRDTNSPWHQFIVRLLQQGKHLEADLYVKLGEPVLAALKKLAAIGRGLEKIDGDALFPGHTDKAAKPQKRFELWAMLLNGGNSSNLERLTLGRGITEEQIRAAAVTVGITDEECEAVQGVIDAFEELGRLSFDLEERDSGLRPEKIEAREWTAPSGKKFRGGYFPAVYDPNTTQVGAQQEASQLFDPGYVRPGTAKGHLKSRVEGFNDVISLGLDSITRHTAQVIHDLAYRERLKTVANLLLDKDIQQTLRTYLGAGKAAVIPQYLRDIGQMRGSESTRTPKLTGLVRWARGNLPAVLGYRLKNAVEDYVSNLSTACLGTGLEMKHLAAALATVKAYDRTAMADAEARFGELRARRGQIQRELVKQQTRLTERDIPGRKALRFYKDNAFIFQEMADRATTAMIALAAERQYLEKHAEEHEENPAKVARDAVTYAEAIVRQVVPSHSPVDQSALMRDKGPVGAFLVFHGFFNQAYNRVADLVEQAVDAKTAKARAMAIGEAIGFMVAISVISGVVRGQGPSAGDEPEDEDLTTAQRRALKTRNYVVRKLLVGAAELHPLTGPLGQAGEALYMGKKNIGARNNTIIGTFESIGKGYVQALDEGKDPDVKVKAFLRTLEPSLGIPTGQAIDTGGFLWDWYEGDATVRGPGDVAGGIYAGQRPGQGGNLGTMLQDLAQ